MKPAFDRPITYQHTCDPTEQHKFKPGDRVIYTNGFGVNFGEKIVAAVALWDGIPRYYYEGTDTPWYPVHEHQLKRVMPFTANQDGTGIGAAPCTITPNTPVTSKGNAA